jgi:hypothetical protein
VIPDVDVALGDVSADAGHDIGHLECVGRGGEQSHRHAVVGANRRYSHRGDDAAALFRGRVDLGLSEGMSPKAEGHAAADEQRGNKNVLRPAPGAIAGGRAVSRPIGTTRRSSASGSSGMGLRTFMRLPSERRTILPVKAF